MAAHYLSEIREVQPHGPFHLAGYCFGAIVAFEMAMTLTREGEEVAMLAMLTGPSATWIRHWGWRGAQPSVRPRFEARMAGNEVVSMTRAARAGRALRDPRRVLNPIRRRARRASLHRALATGAPIPEEARERFFLNLHGRAERAYHEGVYPGEILTFYGDGLYEDPGLGWGPFAAGGVVTHGVPGGHLDNRQLLVEPAVLEVRDRLEEYLARRAVDAAGQPAR
jgi:thioesterase domain-containing protein